MLLTEYQKEFSSIIDEYSETGYISSSEVKVDIRSEHLGLIKASITFINGIRLSVTEYLDLTYGIDKLKYSYHCQDSNGKLMFRYDNALHKPSLGFTNHKHLRNSVIQSDIPDLDSVLYEIVSQMTDEDSFIS